MKKLGLDFYSQAPLAVAQQLIGCYLVREQEEGQIIGRINEVEAYDSAIDKASHAYGGKRTIRNEPLFQAGGIAHVYFIYGMHNCLNVVTGQADDATAVLVRGIEIVQGIELAARNRYAKPLAELTKPQVKNLSNGPGKLCRALAVDRTFDYEPLLGDRLYICEQIDAHKSRWRKLSRASGLGLIMQRKPLISFGVSLMNK